MKRLSDTITSLSIRTRELLLALVDVIITVLCLPLAIVIVTAESSYWTAAASVWIISAAIVPVALAASYVTGLFRSRLKDYDQFAIVRTGAFAALTGVVTAILADTLLPPPASGNVALVFTMLVLIAVVSVRLGLRQAVLEVYRRAKPRQRVLIYGAGQTGVQLAAALRSDDCLEPVAFVDDNPTLQKLKVSGLQVHSPVRVEELVKKLEVERVVLAMPTMSRPKQARLARRLEAAGCDVATLPSFSSLIGDGTLAERIQPFNPLAYLGRDDLDLPSEHSELYTGRTIMITGAGGSIGGELARQITNCRPEKLILFELNELSLYQIDRELTDLMPDDHLTDVIPVLGSVTDPDAVKRTLARHKVDIVLHAAAYKHVPLVEQNQLAGLRNNTLGTRTVATAALESGVKHFILISTDKAVKPTNVMGASKKLAELVVLDLASRSRSTRFGIVRFGNVLGSSGSVVPLFEEQIARGGPVTLTHAEVTRYFMTLTEAARLVLLTGSLIEGGEVLVLDMGAPVPIRNLARQMIEAAGYTVSDAANPDGDIEIVITGLRPGEKLHEQLVDASGTLSPTSHPKILRADSTPLSELETASAIKALTRAVEQGDESRAKEVLTRWVLDPDTTAMRPRGVGDGITGTSGPIPL